MKVSTEKQHFHEGHATNTEIAALREEIARLRSAVEQALSATNPTP
jgi:HAMP domain-containing protein